MGGYASLFVKIAAHLRALERKEVLRVKGRAASDQYDFPSLSSSEGSRDPSPIPSLHLSDSVLRLSRGSVGRQVGEVGDAWFSELGRHQDAFESRLFSVIGGTRGVPV